MKRSLALALAGSAILAGSASAAQVPSIAEGAAQGWPHPPTAVELRDLSRHVSADLYNYIGTPPAVTRCKSFTVCRSGWKAGARVRVALRVWEDGSYRITAVLFQAVSHRP